MKHIIPIDADRHDIEIAQEQINAYWDLAYALYFRLVESTAILEDLVEDTRNGLTTDKYRRIVSLQIETNDADLKKWAKENQT